MPPRSHRYEAAFATSLALHALLLLFVWFQARPRVASGPRAGRSVTMDIEYGSSVPGPQPGALVVKPNPPLLMNPARGLPKPPRHAARRAVQSEDTQPEHPDDGAIPIIRGPAHAQHEAEPQLEDDDDDVADSTAPADDRSDDDATSRSSPLGSNMPGAGGVGGPGGAEAIWAGAANALAGMGGGSMPMPQLAPRVRDDSGTLAMIRGRLAARAKGCYPAAAQRLGITGTAQVRFCVGPDGSATNVQVERGSGDSMLDRAASECVVQGAGALPALDRCVTVPIEFRQR